MALLRATPGGNGASASLHQHTAKQPRWESRSGKFCMRTGTWHHLLTRQAEPSLLGMTQSSDLEGSVT